MNQDEIRKRVYALLGGKRTLFETIHVSPDQIDLFSRIFTLQEHDHRLLQMRVKHYERAPGAPYDFVVEFNYGTYPPFAGLLDFLGYLGEHKLPTADCSEGLQKNYTADAFRVSIRFLPTELYESQSLQERL